MAENLGLMKWFKGLSRLRKTGLIIACAAVFYTILGFLVVPAVVKSVLEKKLPELLHRQVTIEKIRLNPYTLVATIEGLTVQRKNGNGRFISFARLQLNLQSLSVIKKALIVKSITLDGPYIDFDHLEGREYSFSDLLVAGETEETGDGDAGPLLFSINNIQITGGAINYHDLPKEKDHQIADLNLSIPSVSNLPSSIATYVQPAFSAVINGTATALGGQTKPFDDSLATELDINMKGINIPEYLAYVPNPTGLTLASALMDIEAKLAYVSPESSAAYLSMTGSITVSDINVVDGEGRSYLGLPSLTVVMGDSNLLAKEIHLAEIRIDSPRMTISRLAGGEMLPFSLLGPAGADADMSAGEATDGGSDQAPVIVTVDRFTLDDGTLNFTDDALETPAEVKISGISLKASALSTAENAPAGEISYAMQINETGRIDGEGSLAPEPLAVSSSLAVEGLQLKDFQPYISEQVRILIAGGTLSTRGDFAVRDEGEGAPVISFSGMSSLADLAVSDTVIGDDLLKWQEMKIRQIRFSSSPPELLIDEVALQDLYANILVNDDGTVNLATLSVDKGEGEMEPGTSPDGKVATPAETDQQPQNIAINKVLLRNGQVLFRDKSIEPVYGAGLSQLNGSITGLSSQKESRATVKFEGKVDQQAPLAISGSINPLSEEKFADVKIDFNDFNLSPLTPYSGKYAGYKTDKGKLNLDLHYLVEGKSLESTNKVFLDQFTLGDGVESPDATSLPVNLAIALLKNRQGEIRLDIPVSGNLDDPEFSIAGVVLDVIVNLIAKAATSPFALLGSLIPEGEDLQHIVFEPGSAELTTEAEEKMKLLAGVLYERPGLKMDMAGRFDPELDRKALAKLQLEKLVKLEKLKKSGSGKKEDADYRSVLLKQEEYSVYLNKVYEKALKAASDEVRKAAKQVKPADAAERIAHMEKVVLAGIIVQDDELRLLAINRANRVLRYLVEDGKIEPGRLFMIEPHAADKEEAEETVNTMVELSIK